MKIEENLIKLNFLIRMKIFKLLKMYSYQKQKLHHRIKKCWIRFCQKVIFFINCRWAKERKWLIDLLRMIVYTVELRRDLVMEPFLYKIKVICLRKMMWERCFLWLKRDRLKYSCLNNKNIKIRQRKKC